MSIKRTGVMIAGYAVEGTLAKEIMAQPEVVTLEGRRQPLMHSTTGEFLRTWTLFKIVVLLRRLPKHIILVHGQG
jgi:cleavage and polyadenylation specificity factor subunit 3